MALVVWLELAVNGSCVYSCLFTVVKDHRTLLLLVQATHQIMQLALHRLVASLFDPTHHSHYEDTFLHLGRVSGPLYSWSLLILHPCHSSACFLLWDMFHTRELSAGSTQRGPHLLYGWSWPRFTRIHKIVFLALVKVCSALYLCFIVLVSSDSLLWRNLSACMVVSSVSQLWRNSTALHCASNSELHFRQSQKERSESLW